ncbi:unnamed protein product [Hermetia illucens]|uniref:WW domain-containing protein n=1 Tax=Hermetia illucens TaxID=343691 RepID=A0A7R8UBW0_HERIL|nr:transcriptional coactivator yorkie isoform X1 [Hermetia illucens]CAD7077074.1 unnamed protein product [Hermetia illucens]
MAVNNNNNATSPNLNNNTVVDPDSIKQGNLVVRIDQDSDDNLQALFDSVLKPGDTSRPLQVPLRMRKLPDSFFHPPASGSKSSSVSHSRANSTDSAFSTGSQTAIGSSGATGVTSAQPPVSTVASIANRGLAISHSRAHSSPASLQQTYAGLGGGNTQNNNATTGTTNGPPGANATGQTNPVVQHMKQRSYDVVSSIQLQAELGDLPVGWEQARTPEGQIYYLNHITKTTQWEDPRTQIAQQQQQAALAQQQTIQQTAATQAKDTTVDPLGSLPEGWEQAVTSSGEIYFINHINRTTSWFDPRISDYLQRASSLSTRSDLAQSNNWINIRNLEKEREYLKQRQQEIQHQDLLTRQNQQTMGLQMDPFLSGITDHTRQESGDSGLSLSSNNFSVTPDFLSNIDDGMDCLSESGNLDSLSGLDSADDLVPSLQLGDNLCTEMLNDVQSLINSPSTKPDNLNWYKMNIS